MAIVPDSEWSTPTLMVSAACTEIDGRPSEADSAAVAATDASAL